MKIKINTFKEKPAKLYLGKLKYKKWTSNFIIKVLEK